jgi:Transposase zinc-ribbon domain
LATRPALPASEAAAYELLELLRWRGASPSCPHCGTAGRCSYLSPRSAPRPTRTGAASERRVWKCAACRRQFSVLVGTVLQGTRIDLRTWIAVIRSWGALDSPPAVAELVTAHRLSRDGATHMIRRLALALGDPAATSGDERLAALLRLPPDVAARIRHATPPRVRPRPQAGPSAEYG